tara:strand:- start:289 stop:390 length:102 start_codon:yes stop_codon:yes gene_type:complete
LSENEEGENPNMKEWRNIMMKREKTLIRKSGEI